MKRILLKNIDKKKSNVIIREKRGEHMITGNIIILEKNGLHMRPAKKLCQVAGDYKAKISLECGNTTANAKSLLNVLGAGIRQGAAVRVVCDGEDEKEAFEAVMKVLSDIKES